MSVSSWPGSAGTAVSTACCANAGGGPAAAGAELAPASEEGVEGVSAGETVTDVMGGPSETSGVTSAGLTGSMPASICSLGLAGGNSPGSGTGTGRMSATRWSGIGDGGDPVKPDSAPGSVEGVTAGGVATDVIDVESDTRGATSLASPSASARRCTLDGAPAAASAAPVGGVSVAASTEFHPVSGDGGGNGVSAERCRNTGDGPSAADGALPVDPVAGVSAAATATEVIDVASGTSGASSGGLTRLTPVST